MKYPTSCCWCSNAMCTYLRMGEVTPFCLSSSLSSRIRSYRVSQFEPTPRLKVVPDKLLVAQLLSTHIAIMKHLSEDSASGLCPEPDETNHLHNLFSFTYILILCCIIPLGLSCSFVPSRFPTEILKLLLSFRCVLRSLPICPCFTRL